jgi:hypothetical protein
MSGADSLKRAPANRGRLRTIEPAGPDGGSPRRPRRLTGIKCTYRPSDADFFCWKYGVWYNLLDCCYRHARRTFSGCGECGQGQSNLKTNRERFRSVRHLGDRSFSR